MSGASYPLVAPSRRQLRQLKRDNAAASKVLQPVPRDQWPELLLTDAGDERIGVLRSQRFLVQEFLAPGGGVRLSISRTAWDTVRQRWKDGITWDELQQLKREAGYGDQDAVEIYPADADLVDVSNMRHLFVLPEPFPLTWRKR